VSAARRLQSAGGAGASPRRTSDGGDDAAGPSGRPASAKRRPGPGLGRKLRNAIADMLSTK
jgi:hypothetical protein